MTNELKMTGFVTKIGGQGGKRVYFTRALIEDNNFIKIKDLICGLNLEEQRELAEELSDCISAEERKHE